MDTKLNEAIWDKLPLLRHTDELCHINRQNYLTKRIPDKFEHKIIQIITGFLDHSLSLKSLSNHTIII